MLEVIWTAQERDALTPVTELDLDHKQMTSLLPRPILINTTSGFRFWPNPIKLTIG